MDLPPLNVRHRGRIEGRAVLVYAGKGHVSISDADALNPSQILHLLRPC
jgi:hypothetical protein